MAVVGEGMEERKGFVEILEERLVADALPEGGKKASREPEPGGAPRPEG